MINFNAHILDDNILHLEFNNIRDQTITLFRPSEYYESPHPNINGKMFSYEDFLLTYIRPNGEITYFKDWPAFNIPGHVFSEFWEKFDNVSSAEGQVYDLIKSNINMKKPYYIISNLVGDKGGYEHELAHAIYYLDEQYKIDMDNELKNVSSKIMKKLYKGLTKIGYPMNIQHIVDDEAQSWLATSHKNDFDIEFNFTMEEIGETHKKFKKIFKQYSKQIKSKKI